MEQRPNFDRDRQIAMAVILASIALALLGDIIVMLDVPQLPWNFLIDSVAVIGVLSMPIWISVRYRTLGLPAWILPTAGVLMGMFLVLQPFAFRKIAENQFGISQRLIQIIIIDGAIEVSVGLIILSLVLLVIRVSQHKEEAARTAQEHQQTLSELAHAQRLASVGTLAAGIAHEINNPLWMIGLEADVALAAARQNSDDSQVTESLDTIKSLVSRAGNIIGNVLQFSKPRASERWQCDIVQIAQSARAIAERLAGERGVSMKLADPGPLPEVDVNPSEIEQVFVNVLFNAIEASRPGELVSIGLKSILDGLKVTITDRGIGMTPEENKHAFDPFFTKRKNMGGTGLGLSISHGIIEQHGGTISIESQPGKGTTVSVVLPFAKNEP